MSSLLQWHSISRWSHFDSWSGLHLYFEHAMMTWTMLDMVFNFLGMLNGQLLTLFLKWYWISLSWRNIRLHIRFLFTLQLTFKPLLNFFLFLFAFFSFNIEVHIKLVFNLEISSNFTLNFLYANLETTFKFKFNFIWYWPYLGSWHDVLPSRSTCFDIGYYMTTSHNLKFIFTLIWGMKITLTLGWACFWIWMWILFH